MLFSFSFRRINKPSYERNDSIKGGTYMILLVFVLFVGIGIALAILGSLLSIGVVSGFLVMMFADVIVFGVIVYLIIKKLRNRKKKK